MQVWAVVIQAVGVVAMLFAAVFAWKAASATERTTRAELVFRLRKEYDSAEMLAALDLLRDWREAYGEGCEKLWIAAKNDKTHALHKEALELNLARRKVTNYFAAPLELGKPYLKKKDVSRILMVDGRGILFEIVEPMEFELNHNYNKALFQRVRALVGTVALIPRTSAA